MMDSYAHELNELYIDLAMRCVELVAEGELEQAKIMAGRTLQAGEDLEDYRRMTKHEGV